mmetsp:Transcript_43731/g.126341  ORF Transcript_43731/g.126341 Transcript_43731/m.126341 type:complete len:274 (-) Transcript_43731:833-1654(-)
MGQHGRPAQADGVEGIEVGVQARGQSVGDAPTHRNAHDIGPRRPHLPMHQGGGGERRGARGLHSSAWPSDAEEVVQPCGARGRGVLPEELLAGARSKTIVPRTTRPFARRVGVASGELRTPKRTLRPAGPEQALVSDLQADTLHGVDALGLPALHPEELVVERRQLVCVQEAEVPHVAFSGHLLIGVVEVMVPARERNTDDGVCATCENGPIVLGAPDAAGDPARQRCDIDSLPRVGVQGRRGQSTATPVARCIEGNCSAFAFERLLSLQLLA